jgi:hypothetical protein
MRDKPVMFALCLLCQVMLSTTPAAAKIKGGYLDFLLTEAAGELRGQSYDAYHSRDGNDVFVGNQQIDPRRGTLLAAGFGLRLVLATERGLRFSGEGSLQGGRLLGLDPAFSASTVTRGELLAGLGYQRAFGRVVLHVAGIFGGDYAEFSLAPPAQTAASVSTSPSTPSVTMATTLGLGDPVTLRRWGMRLGAQAGAHVQLTKLVALYGDVTFDYDGQWRSRLGIAIGEPGGPRAP